MEWQDAEFFKLHAEELNREAEDVLKYQGDIFDLFPRMKHEAGRTVPGFPPWPAGFPGVPCGEPPDADRQYLFRRYLHPNLF
jgi:hypothetical protein